MLNSPVPLVLLWGTAGSMLYNDAYGAFAAAAAIANAVFNATGKRVRDLPIALDKLL